MPHAAHHPTASWPLPCDNGSPCVPVPPLHRSGWAAYANLPWQVEIASEVAKGRVLRLFVGNMAGARATHSLCKLHHAPSKLLFPALTLELNGEQRDSAGACLEPK